jgi:hypothetical protein
MPPVTRALAHNTMALLLFLPVSVFAAGSAGEPVAPLNQKGYCEIIFFNFCFNLHFINLHPKING